MRRLADLNRQVEDWGGLEESAGSLAELVELAIEERDDSLLGGVAGEFAEIAGTLERLELDLTLSGEYDDRNAFIALHAGAGGIDSQDWAGMLTRMYGRWAEASGMKTELLDSSPGDEGGFKRATLQVNGPNAYGYLKSERGVHRLVRLSPFDADHARHTSFALVEVMPEVEEGVDVVIVDDDIKIEAFSAGGHGGQSVQKNSTAVRITHLPTGLKVVCQNERSQYQNRTIAMRILLSRLAELERQKRAEELAEIKGDHVSAEWGNQIRSYVLHPYKMVKDHRTGHETSDAEKVLDGDLDGFIRSYLTSTVGAAS
jgi:peptide chain release factor 2